MAFQREQLLIPLSQDLAKRYPWAGDIRHQVVQSPHHDNFADVPCRIYDTFGFIGNGTPCVNGRARIEDGVAVAMTEQTIFSCDDCNVAKTTPAAAQLLQNHFGF